MLMLPGFERCRQLLWLGPAALCAVLTLLIMVVLPADRTLHSVWDFAFKISPVLLAVATIALLPRHRGWAPFAVILGCAVFLGVIDSGSFMQVSALLDAALANSAQTQFAAYYRFSTFVDAFVVLFGLLAYRLGGAGTESVLRLGLAATCLLVSGLNDLTMWAMYAWPDGVRPETFDWASHVAVFLGRPPHLVDMVVFCVVHVSLAGLVMIVPWPRNTWDQRLHGRQQAGRLIPPASLGSAPAPPER
jgi:hypothetical protein